MSWQLSDSKRFRETREIHAGVLGQQHRDLLAELGMRIDTGADRGTALREPRKARAGCC